MDTKHYTEVLIDGRIYIWEAPRMRATCSVWPAILMR